MLMRVFLGWLRGEIGLVPISPNTTPWAPSSRTALEACSAADVTLEDSVTPRQSRGLVPLSLSPLHDAVPAQCARQVMGGVD